MEKNKIPICRYVGRQLKNAINTNHMIQNLRF